jgi:hypothetical protein
MTTPTPTSTSTGMSVSDLDKELLIQYDGLSDDLKDYFDERQQDFLNEAQSNYTNPANYTTDRNRFILNNKIESLETRRSEVWDYLVSEFNNNTKDKYLNAKMMSQNKKDMTYQKKTLDDLQEKYNSSKDKNSTYGRQREIALYDYNHRLDQLFLMKVIGGLLILCLILALLIRNEILPSEVAYVVLALFALLVGYTVYHVYLKAPNRSRRQWDKYYFKQPDLKTKTDASTIDPDFDYDKFDKKIDGEFSKYLDTCKSPQS